MMHFEAARKKTLIVGCDYPTLFTYRKVYAERSDLDICGFVFCLPNLPPISTWNSSGHNKLPIYPIKNLEQIIRKENVNLCIINTNGILMKKVQSIIFRIMSTGTCAVEFVSPAPKLLNANKPVLAISSFSNNVGKTQIAKYFSDILFKLSMRVAVILPIEYIDPVEHDEDFQLEKAPFYQFNLTDKVSDEEIAAEAAQVIRDYQMSGVSTIIFTANINRAIIVAEQLADVIIYDSSFCSVPLVETHSKFCVINRDSVLSPMRTSNWPGLVNAFDSNYIITLTPSDAPATDADKIFLKKQINFKMNSQTPKRFFYTNLRLKIDADLRSKKVAFLDSNGTNFRPSPSLSSIAPLEKVKKDTNLPSAFSTSALSEIDDDNMATADVDKIQPWSLSRSPAFPQIDKAPFAQQGLNNIPYQIQYPHTKGLCRSLSPCSIEVRKESKYVQEKIKESINTSDADIIIADLPMQIHGVSPSKHLIYATREVIDLDHQLFEWINNTFFNNRKPPLQKHFDSQVDVLQSMVNASLNELSVVNNDSANREAFTRLFLQSHIPPNYRVTTGEIFDCSMNHTGQLDVVITNDESPTMTIDSSGSIIAPILADSVLGVVEVKTTLNVETLKKALSQLRPVKALMPSHETLKDQDGNIIPDPLGGKIVTGIFAYGVTGDVEGKFGEIVNLYPHVADFIVIPGQFAFFSAQTLEVCKIGVGAKEIHNGYVEFNPKGMGLALIFGVLNSLAAIRQFSGSNFIRYLGGAWGGRQEEIDRETHDIQTSIMRTQQLAGREHSEKEQAEIVQSGTELLNIFGNIFSNNNQREQRRKPKKIEEDPPADV